MTSVHVSVSPELLDEVKLMLYVNGSSSIPLINASEGSRKDHVQHLIPLSENNSCVHLLVKCYLLQFTFHLRSGIFTNLVL